MIYFSLTDITIMDEEIPCNASLQICVLDCF